jgi:hypothetical protein
MTTDRKKVISQTVYPLCPSILDVIPIPAKKMEEAAYQSMPAMTFSRLGFAVGRSSKGAYITPCCMVT